MKIYDSPTDDFWKAAGLDAFAAPVISVVGAGGKTSLIKAMSEALSFRGISHGIMTTTHMWPMDTGRYGHLFGSLDKNGKLGMPEEETIRRLLSEKIPVLIEADGSHELPCKAPEVWEPVLRPETTHVFGVLGASCLGKKIRDCCHRPQRVMDILNCSEEHRLTADDLAELGSSPRGLMKNVTGEQHYSLVINQVDDDRIYQNVKQVRDRLGRRGIEHVYFVRMYHR